MKKFLLFFYILVFLLKTGNVLSNNSIFNVNNIQIDKKLYKNTDNFLDKAFKKGFEKLSKRILLKKDLSKVSNLDLKEIKNLISYYQIDNEDLSEGQNKDIIKVNLQFDREKLNNFFYQKNILYSDLKKSEVIVFPLHVKNDNTFIFDDNYFYNNWVDQKEINNKDIDQIEYLLPIESLEIIQLIKNKNKEIESINVSEIIDDYKVANKFFIIIFENNANFSFFLKGSINGKKVVKNFKYIKSNFNKDLLYKDVINQAKSSILEIIKSKNLIDIKTPSFLNLELSIKNKNDLFKTREILKNIDLIEKYNVLALTKDTAKIKVKHFGKMEQISEKLKDKGIELKNFENVWTMELL